MKETKEMKNYKDHDRIGEGDCDEGHGDHEHHQMDESRTSETVAQVEPPAHAIEANVETDPEQVPNAEEVTKMPQHVAVASSDPPSKSAQAEACRPKIPGAVAVTPDNNIDSDHPDIIIGGEDFMGDSIPPSSSADTTASAGVNSTPIDISVPPSRDSEESKEEEQINRQVSVASVESAPIMLRAELVMAPVEAYQVDIDLDVSELGFEIEQPPAHGDNSKKRKVRFTFMICLFAIPFIIATSMIPVFVPLNFNENSEDEPTSAPTFPYFCYTSTKDIVEAQRMENSLPEAYIICPNTSINVGMFRNPAVEDYTIVNGDFPIWATRPNVTIQCGLDGRRENNCTLNGGFVQVTTASGVPTEPEEADYISQETTDDFLLRGITFTGVLSSVGVTPGSSVTLSHPGKRMTIEDCAWIDMSVSASLITITRNFFQTKLEEQLDDRVVDITFANCTFSNIVYDAPLFFVAQQNLTVESTRFDSIVLSELVDTCRWEAVPQYSMGLSGPCASLLMCQQASICNLRDLCLSDFESASPALLLLSEGSQFSSDNLRWGGPQDQDTGVCQAKIFSTEPLSPDPLDEPSSCRDTLFVPSICT